MKKICLVAAILLLGANPLFAQCYKYPLFEHFTQASCGPCAQQNPGFQSSILDPNPNSLRHIAYHTSWPGTDPMYSANTSQSNDRVSYYGVTGVPDVFLEGNYKEAQPGGMTMTDVNDVISKTSPIKIVVSDVDNGTSHDVAVTVKSIGEPPTGSFKLVAVVIERFIHYNSAPGTNGEKDFPNVMRKILPSSNGQTITLPAQGEEATYNFTYDEDASWNMDTMGVVAFIQKSTKEIINAGSTFDIPQNAIIIAPALNIVDGTPGNAESFDFSTGNSSDTDEDFIFSLATDAPSDWSGSYTISGVDYFADATITMAGNSQLPAAIHVTPGVTPAVGRYTLTISSAGNPDAPVMMTTVSVVSGITDLIVSNAAGNGVTDGDASTWQNFFIDGLDFAGSTSHDAIMSTDAINALNHGALTGVKNLYLNIGWTFPGLTDEFVNLLRPYLDNGGNLMITGQDVAWEVFDDANSPYATQNKQDFFTDYLGVGWISDGNSTNKPLTANPSDIFTAVPAAGIVAYYGGSYFYPDQLSAEPGAIPTFFYNNTTRIAGVRSDYGHKVVYLGIGLEMVASSTDKNNIMKTTYDWFHGNITSAEFDATMATLGNNYPNPAGDFTLIPVEGISGDVTLTVFNELGQVVFEKHLGKNASDFRLDTAELPQGAYHYRIASGEFDASRTFVVAH
jgi:hypothetical protein